MYRARDTKLRREVAIKALPAQFAADPERRTRFEREAHLLASLNHPNVAAIYGLEEAGDAVYLVLSSSRAKRSPRDSCPGLSRSPRRSRSLRRS